MAGPSPALLGNRRPSPVERRRLCSRPGCDDDASATMSFDYTARTAWLDELDADACPAGYDLCATHADRLGVPGGWSRSDRRVASSPFTRLAV